MPGKIKKYFYILLLIELMLNYIPAQVFAADQFDYATKAGVSDQIKAYLCAPSDVQTKQTETGNAALTMGQTDFQNYAAANNANSGDLYKCINQLYKFAIILSAVIGVFFIVIAGYIYMSADGNQESVDKAKNILVTTITSMVILMAGYLLLKAINPDLVQFKSIQPPSVQMNTTAWQSYKTPTEPGAKENNLTKKCVGDAGVAVCTNCQDYNASSLKPANSTEKPGCNTFLNSSLISKLQTAQKSYPAFAVTEAYPPTVPHLDSCHNNGTCADITPASRTADEFEKLCMALYKAGVSITNESGFQTQSCGKPQTFNTTTGQNLHVK